MTSRYWQSYFTRPCLPQGGLRTIQTSFYRVAMNSLVPSRRLLRQLASACHDSACASPSRSPTRTICSISQRHDTISRPGPRYKQGVPVGKLAQTRLASINSSSSSTSASTKESFSSSTSTRLPDISNYYTLFPSTLPHGPPPNG